MARILIVDDEEKIRTVIREYAVFNNYETDEAADGVEAVNKCLSQDYDLVIMDIMMPRLDGYSACKQIRRDKDIPIIMLSARGEEYDKLFGFELGIDDYVVKPFSPKELMARVSAVLARKNKGEDEKKQTVLRSGDLEVNTESRIVTVAGEKIDL
ncbi:MAG: response regulator transcription factor, partial [Firmicutes bacterium]|nr:response regulator transcription factor [Bacillota bacterium]